MTIRRGAAALLLGSAGLGWLASRHATVGALVSGWAAVSVAYTGVLAWSGHRLMRKALRGAQSESLTGSADGLPFVTLMVPARDEAPVIAGIVGDLAAQRYARGGTPHFEVVVIDDGSTDDTGSLARAAGLHGRGPVHVLRRPPGSGPELRGAALNYATPRSSGDVIAALDADARVGPHYIEGAMRAWQRYPEAAALQTLKRPVNASVNWLTHAQEEELLLDMASQCGRWSAGGSGELRGNGMFIKRDALDRVGGWGNDALTEDLDMSTRVVAAGERIAVAPEVTVGEEAVEEVRPLWHQRMRWAEGSLRRSISHGTAVVRAAIPLRVKIDALAFLITESALPAFIASAVVSAAARRRGRRPWRVPVMLVGSYAGALAALAFAGLAADGRRGPSLVVGTLRGAAFLAHWLVVVPAALVRLAFGPERILYVKTPRVAPAQTFAAGEPPIAEEAAAAF